MDSISHAPQNVDSGKIPNRLSRRYHLPSHGVYSPSLHAQARNIRPETPRGRKLPLSSVPPTQIDLVEMPVAPIDNKGTVIHYEDTGAPIGLKDYTTLVLIHGFLFHGGMRFTLSEEH